VTFKPVPLEAPPCDLEAETSIPQVFKKALLAQGFTELTAVQKAILESDLDDHDLRLCSQTGSGKTVALGLLIGKIFLDGSAAPFHEDGRSGPASPKILMIAPTRDLAAQLGKELSWLYGSLHVGIAVVTGGTSVARDLRALSAGPEVVVGTPGRLVDHLNRGILRLDQLQTVVLDEADEMLDMGFRDELEAILDRTPEHRRTHMASATFSHKVEKLANRYQTDAVMVEGTIGADHEDISHTVIVVEPRHRVDALINLLLLQPDQRLLVFVRTRVAAASVAGELSSLGFSVSALSGEMAQRERARCLADFRAHRLQCVVATDVAARGLDIRGVSQIVQFDLPDSIEAFTHRSGRTGRAGEKGTSLLLVPPSSRRRVERLFQITGIDASWGGAPSPKKIRKAQRRRLLSRYGPNGDEQSAAGEGSGEGATRREEIRELAETLLEDRPALDLVTQLLRDLSLEGPTEPRSIPEPGQMRKQDKGQRRKDKRNEFPASSPERRPEGSYRDRKGPPQRSASSERGPRNERPSSDRTFGDRTASDRTRSEGDRGRPERPVGSDSRFVPFHVSWGSESGASPKRLLAHVCRRAGIDGKDVGAIKIHEYRSVVDVSAAVAEKFERAAARPDPRNPKVHIQRFVTQDERGGASRPGRPSSPDGDRGRPSSRPPRGKDFKGGKPPGGKFKGKKAWVGDKSEGGKAPGARGPRGPGDRGPGGRGPGKPSGKSQGGKFKGGKSPRKRS
jgi:ATP-dependent RNA helicase DeaD